MLNIPLIVKRKLQDGQSENVGQLAEDSNGVYFQYAESYLNRHRNSLAPFNLEFNNRLQLAPKEPHCRLHGVFGDSLPDGWGLYLMDRLFRRNGYISQNITALERLAVVGNRGLGALFYEPELSFNGNDKEIDIELLQLGREAVSEFEGTESHLIQYLMDASGSGGARPKLNVTQCADGSFTTRQDAVGDKLIIKLTSEKFTLGHHESQVEYVYMDMARQAGIEVPDFDLFDAGRGHYWLKQKRFDCINEHGRIHMISACGLLDAPFRIPSLDYVDLIKATRLLCGVSEAKKLLRRALFNYLTINQDDHSKNFAFLADDQDKWRISPFYDVVYSPLANGEHMTAFNGNGAKITRQAMELMAGQAGLSGANAIKQQAEEIYEVVKNFHIQAKFIGIPDFLIKEIQQHIDIKWASLFN